MPLSGLMFCADCGGKMRLGHNNTTNGSKKLPRKYVRHNYQCGAYSRYGKFYCTSHYIKMKEDKILGKIPEDVCVNLPEKYQAERKELSEEADRLDTAKTKKTA